VDETSWRPIRNQVAKDPSAGQGHCLSDGEHRGITKAQHQPCPTRSDARAPPAPHLLPEEGLLDPCAGHAPIPRRGRTAHRDAYEVNNPIDVWDSDTGAVTHSLTDHAGCVRALVSYELEPGQGHIRLASAHGRVGGGTLVLWAVNEAFRQVASVVAHQSGVTSLLLLDNGGPEGEGRPRLVSGGATVKV
jgi:hypothetical protein